MCRARSGDLLLGPQYHLSQECVSVSLQHPPAPTSLRHGLRRSGVRSLSLSGGAERASERKRESGHVSCLSQFVSTCVCGSAFLIFCGVFSNTFRHLGDKTELEVFFSVHVDNVMILWEVN